MISYGKIYLKAAKNSLVKGSDYAKNEIQRLQRILDKVITIFPIDDIWCFTITVKN